MPIDRLCGGMAPFSGKRTPFSSNGLVGWSPPHGESFFLRTETIQTPHPKPQIPNPQVLLCFGPGSAKGDTFVVRHVALVPVEAAKPEGVLVKTSHKGCPSEHRVPEGAKGVMEMYESLLERVEGDQPPLHHYSVRGIRSTL